MHIWTAHRVGYPTKVVSNILCLFLLSRFICKFFRPRIYKWSEEWQMLFNVDKCVVMHLGNRNKKFNYSMGDTEIKTVTNQKDLGVLVSNSIKYSEQCSEAAKAGNKILGLIRRNIQFKSKDIIVRLYKALVRPKLEYCVQAWSPYCKKDIAVLEQVQKRATKMIVGLYNLSYEGRLKVCELTTLEKRRIRGDLIETYKILKGFENVDHKKFFHLNSDCKTRGHSLKLSKCRSSLDLRKYFFSQRVVDYWNRLPQHVVEADTVNTFKNRLDKFDKYD